MIKEAAQVSSAAGTTEYAIEIEGMRKAYGRTLAVRHLSMHVPAGSIYGFVGPNGAGKSTTIRTLATLQKADAGSVQVMGIDIAAHPALVRDHVGYMPDFFGVYDSLSVSEYLHFYGASHGVDGAKRRQLVGELLELVDLTDKRDDPVEALSRGMKQRLGLARCLIHDPAVLLLDEPASGMDPRARIELREILRELRAMDKTILISSHILPELAEMCTHIGVIRAGEILAEGPVDEVIAALTEGTRLHITLLDPDGAPGAAQALRSYPGVNDVQVEEGRRLVADIEGDEAALASLLGHLVGLGLPITEFRMDRGSLEDIFLQVVDLGEED
ncbi:MAG TPA: ABC transporter ATP-binding protein [Chloroflexota bacterium]|nr:ABC transporter ATP-binding protein [Chloroflexota bacterium]